MSIQSGLDTVWSNYQCLSVSVNLSVTLTMSINLSLMVHCPLLIDTVSIPLISLIDRSLIDGPMQKLYCKTEPSQIAWTSQADGYGVPWTLPTVKIQGRILFAHRSKGRKPKLWHEHVRPRTLLDSRLAYPEKG